MIKRALLITCLILIFIFSVIAISFAWEFILQGRIQETFDDNINSSIHDKKYDLISEFMVGLGVRHEGKTQTLEIAGHVIEQVYSMNFGLTNNAQDITLNYTKEFSELISVQVADVFQNYPEPDRFAVLFGHSRGRMRYYRNNFNLTGLFTVNVHYSINIHYANQFSKYFYTHTQKARIYDYADGSYNVSNLHTSLMQTARMQHELHWTSSNMSFIYYAYEWMKHDPGGISQVHTPGAGHRYNFTPQLYAEFRVAPDLLLPAPATLNYSLENNIEVLTRRRENLQVRLFTLFTLVNEVDKKTNASLTFTYQNTVMSNTPDIISNWRLEGDVRRHIFPRLLLTSSLFYGQGVNYAENSTNRLFGFLITVAYEFTEHLSVSASYNFTLNYTELNGYNVYDDYIFYNNVFTKENRGYLRNRVSLALNAEF